MDFELTPKEKAHDLWKVHTGLQLRTKDIKEIISNLVDEILKAYNPLEYYPEELRKYWDEVKLEIEKL